MTKYFIHAFIDTATRRAQHVAIETPQGRITYGELLERAGAIAAYLRAQNLPAESVIGLCIEKSADYIAALLGVWYAGLAFAPLPPSLPAARRDFIIRDADIRFFLTADNLLVACENAALPAPAVIKGHDLAYVMHTSGSTGTPKGVMVEQRGILPVLEAQIKAFDMNAQSRSLFYLSTSFDASLSDIGTALLAGGTLVIADDATLKDGGKLCRLLHDAGITHCDMPPSLLRVLRPEDMPQSLRCIIIGGEACPPDTVRRWAAQMKVINVYGPTEATICTSLCPCDAQTWQRPLLGQPFDSVEYRIIDEELYIGGIQLARGYLNLPDLTARKFVDLDGRRFYRSGDRVRALPNGDIEFLGRIDRQFKLRGQLVEPDEIETQLQNMATIRKAAVIKTPEPAQLIAYVTAESDIDSDGIQSALEKILPAWMIPAHIIRLPELPLTVTGKTDYAALAAMPAPRSTNKTMPETAAEKTHWDLWRGVIGHDDFGIDQSFYSAGGDSLGIIRLTLDAAQKGMDARPAAIAKGKTIRDIASIDTAADNGMDADILRRSVAIDSEKITRAAARSHAPVGGAILLTGATGCLGSRVLHGLLAEGAADIYCIVRANNNAAAHRRVIDKMTQNHLPLTPAQEGRIKALAGDVSQPMFGLDASVYNQLADSISAVYHCAATVNMLADFDELAPANLHAVRAVLDFALAGHRKDLHMASTLSVFVSTDQNSGTLREDDHLQNVKRVYGGYAQTKFAAEYMLLQVPPEACPIWHYRFGLLTGDTGMGIAPDRDFLSMFARGISSLGAAPEGFDDKLHVDITPVDYAARAMLHLSRRAPAAVYHIANPSPLSLGDLLGGIERAGQKISRLPPAAWAEMLANRPMDTAESAAALALCRTGGRDVYAQNRIMDLFQTTDVTFDMTAANRYLLPAGIDCPATDASLVDLYMRGIFAPAPKPLRVCLFGPESTGKSTLAARLASHYQTLHCPEFAKDYLAAQNGEIAYKDIPALAAGQRSEERKAAAQAKDILICDTDLLTTEIWSRWLFGDCPAWVGTLGAAAEYDVYLLMDIDTPWVADVHRYLPDNRADFMAQCRATLDKHAKLYHLLSGSWEDKFASACRIIDNLTAKEEAA